MMKPNSLLALRRAIQRADEACPLVRIVGRVTAVSPVAIVIKGLSHHVRLGSMIAVQCGPDIVACEVIRLDHEEVVVRAFDSERDIRLGANAWSAGQLQIHPHESWRGRMIDAFGRAIDSRGELARGDAAYAVTRAPPEAMAREPVKTAVTTGVRAIDLFTPICLGQRLGVFAGSGVGKSTLLAMLARAAGFKTVIIGLVGERGREVRDLMEGLPPEAACKSVCVVSTGDESAMMRRLAPHTAMCLAEYFRDRGEDVLLIMDSVTRYAHACRDVAMAAGEPPVARGYPPSVFGDLPRLLERAGPGHGGVGSITGLFSVLVDGDDHNDPVADSIRGTLDGHVVLDRDIAESGRYPAIDISASLSRLGDRVWTAEQRRLVSDLRRLVNRFEESRDLRALGGYRAGSDEELDRALATVPRLYRIVNQRFDDASPRDVYREAAECFGAERSPAPA